MGNAAKKIIENNDSPDDNLETFGLLWLDANVDTSEENRQAQNQLRHIINHLKIFDNQNLCQQYILSVSSHNRLILIVSGRLGQEIVPHIHHLRQISSIYVYCTDKETHEKWAKHFTKVKGVIVQLKDLIDRIKLDQTHRVKIEEPLPLNIFSVARNPDRSTTKLNGYFLHSLLFIDVLLRMKSIESDKQQLITLCKNEYKDNTKQLANVHEFEEQYSSDTALYWYARECFLYKILNKALRVQNIDLLFLIRFVINDIYQQLKKYQCKTSIRVYRGQVMSNEELNNLKNSIGQLISINSYFSTSVDRSVALFMLGDPNVSYNLQRVLFIIEADPHVARTKPFAEIHSVSCFANELEVLFMVGSIFRLIDIRCNKKDLIWEIRMKLCGDDEHDLKNLFDYMKKEYGCDNNEVDLLSFGNVLLKMGEFDRTEKIYRRLLAERLSNDPSNDHLYYSLGMVTKDKGEYDLSLYWYFKSLKMKSQINPSDYISIGSLYNCIGVVHQEKGTDNEALKWYNEAIKLFKRNNDENHPYMADVYNNIGTIYNGQMNSSKALQFFQKSLTIQEKHLPSNHPDVGRSYLNIGGIYYGLRHYDVAMKYYDRSLGIWLKSLPPKHPKIAGNYSNIGLVHERTGELIQALVYYQKSVEIYHHSLPSQHPSVIQLEKHIKNILIIFSFRRDQALRNFILSLCNICISSKRTQPL